jgi:tetratricopeptide (TPR) repeat protein
MSATASVHDVVWQTYKEVGTAAFEEGQLDIAEMMFKAALQHARRTNESRLRQGAIAINLALIYSRQERFREAELLCRRAIKMHVRLLGQWHQQVGVLYCDLGEIYAAQAKNEHARRAYEQALLIIERNDDTAQLLFVLKKFGSILCRLRSFSDAEEVFERINILQKSSERTS